MRAFLGLLLASSSAWAGTSAFDVTVRGGNKLAGIAFATKATVAKPCWLEPASVALALPETAGGVGKIDITTRVDVEKPCLEVEGPERGVIAFPTDEGARLPGIPFGSYRLRINGENAGTLVTGKNAVELVDE